MQKLLKNEWTTFAGAMLASILTWVLTATHANSVLTFVISAVALATLATVVGHATEQLGNYLGPGATGILQAAVGNLPELFVGFFALQAGVGEGGETCFVGFIFVDKPFVFGVGVFFCGGEKVIHPFYFLTHGAVGILLVLS